MSCGFDQVRGAQGGTGQCTHGHQETLIDRVERRGRQSIGRQRPNHLLVNPKGTAKTCVHVAERRGIALHEAIEGIGNGRVRRKTHGLSGAANGIEPRVFREWIHAGKRLELEATCGKWPQRPVLQTQQGRRIKGNQTLRWMRLVGDSVFIAGVAALVWFVAGLRFGWSYQESGAASAQPVDSRFLPDAMPTR